MTEHVLIDEESFNDHQALRVALGVPAVRKAHRLILYTLCVLYYILDTLPYARRTALYYMLYAFSILYT